VFLPPAATGAQVNDNRANSIDPSQDPGVSDVAVTARKHQVHGERTSASSA
jgi:hypothetical protein